MLITAPAATPILGVSYSLLTTVPAVLPGRPVSRLLAAGAMVNLRAYNGMTPLHWAVMRGHEEIAVTLVDAGEVVQMLLSQREQEEEADHLLGQVNAAVPGALVPFHAQLIERRRINWRLGYLSASPASTSESFCR